MLDVNNMVGKIICGDALEVLKTMPDDCIDCVVTSPPYWNLRDYKVDGQLGLEPTFQEFIEKLVEIFEEIRRVLKSNGTCFVNLGDTYGSGSGKDKNRVHSKQGTMKNWIDGKKSVKGYEKCLLMIPERFAIAMCEQGWKLRNKIVWHKKNAMPSSVTDRLSNKYEFVYFFTKSKSYYFDLDSIRMPFETKKNWRFGKRLPPKNSGGYERNPKGKNPGDVWTLTLQPHPEKHIAMFPKKLITPVIKAGCPVGGVCLDPFSGAGTTALVAKELGRNFVGIELSEKYIEMAKRRLAQEMLI